ncbi:SusC/RagA family TonB-linked outer membrane protein [Tenacibaculum sp. FZY0031]|uniref:SusC/RagA family TonB-linked outer membrane protein n=1 Tax=Tenacibaculum sp. FZY0031 TaxID=3116648 RepID=UPI002EB43AA1|nr:SusC/RagA family TonB-linked outer membrane protein [Tenacibaculum sp. FZY0031]
MKSKFMLTLFIVLLGRITYAQEKSISGTVSDTTGPLPGVTVLIKNTTKGTETDFDGNYTIKVNQGDVLVFSFIGKKTTEVKVQNQSVINLVLEDDSNILNEVEVIATGYDKINKKSFAGSAVSVGIDDLKLDGVVDVTRMLEGRVAGVNIQNISGTFGAAPKITIRGNSSIFGNNTPLYVIDGVVQEDIIETDLDQLASGNAETLLSSSIAGINANDIKKIDILKDASATSLYGARARNGVVVITTKNGRKSSPIKINYSLEQTVSDIPNYSQFDILNSKENFSILKELESKGFLELPNVAQARYGGVYYIAADKTNTYDPLTGEFALENTPEARNKFFQQYELANTNWFKTLFRRSISQNHSLNITGGGDNNAFYSSISFFNDPGWTIAEKVNRLTFNLKNTFYLSDKFNLTFASNASIRKQKAPGTFSRQTDSFNGDVSRDFDINPFSYALNTSRTLRPRDNNGNLEYYRNNWANFNILEETENNYMDIDVKDVRFQIDASYKLTDKLTYDFNSAARYVNSTIEHNIKENSNVVGAYNADETTIVRDANIFLYTDPNNPDALPISVLPNGGIYIKTDNTLTSYYLRNSLTYKDVYNEKHGLDAFIGQELRYVDRDRNSFTGYGLQFGNGYTPFTDPRILEKIITQGDDYYSISQERERTVAFFGKATYSYDDKYIFSLTGRYDGSNRQGKSSSSRWLPTGSVSAKWNAKEENFLKDSDVISNLSFRTSYGLVATPGSATNASAIFRSIITDRLSPQDRETYLNIAALQNSELTWEKQYELNFGVDLSMFNNKVSLSADVYKRDIFDNVDFVRTSGIGGQFIKQGNNADVESKGFELSLNTKNIVTDNFSWSTTFNVSYINQKITNLENKPIALDLVDATGANIEGYPINSLFSYKFEGLDNRGLPTFKLPEGSNPSTGADFQDTENLTDYLVYEGSVDPNISVGLSNTFKYKNWNLNVLITGAGGNKIRLNPSFSSRYSDLNVFSRQMLSRWQNPGDENLTNVPVIASTSMVESIDRIERAYNAYNYSTERVADGDFLRMKSISLGYNFNKDFTDKLGLSNFSLKFQGTNLFLLYSDSKLRGQDPEFYSVGGVALPIRRQFTMSVNLGI